MRDETKRQRIHTSGFTLTELLVLVGVSSMLAGLLMADLAQTKSKLLQQACAANMKQWGMAFFLYSQDYNGTLFYSVGGANWDDSGANPPNPYVPYLGGGNATVTIRTLRICPAAAPRIAAGSGSAHSYSMPIGTYRKGLAYASADMTGSPFFDNASFGYFPNLRSVPNPSKFLLLIDSNGHTLHCGGLHSAVTTVLQTDADQVPAINRHLALINCLFGDFHAEALPIEKIDAMDGNCATAGTNLNYTFALN